MKKIYSLFLLFFIGSAVAFAYGGQQKLKLNPNLVNKAAKLHERINGTMKKAPVKEAESEEWNLLGTGKYTDDIITTAGVPSLTWDVQVYESATAPGFYRVENPYGNGNCPYFDGAFECCDFLLHAEDPDNVWMEYVEIKNVDFGLTEDTYCPGYVGDMAGYYIDMGYFDAETAVAMGMASGKLKGGNITFEPNSLILDFPLYPSAEGLSFETNTSGLFRVMLPGASDYSFHVDSKDICTDNTLTVSYTAGKDVAQVKYSVFNKMRNFRDSDEEIYDEVNTNGTVAEGGSFTIEPEFGMNTLAIVALSAEGEMVEKSTVYCFGQQENAEQWKPVGKATYSEDVLASIYPEDCENKVYEVDIEEDVNTPGRYRLIDLYGPAYPYYNDLLNDENIVSHTHHHYVVVDTTNPDMVFIEGSPLGLDFGYGQVSFFSEGWLSMMTGADLTDESVLEGFGTLKDGKITFLGGALFVYMPEFGLLRGNINHKFYIQLPETTAIKNIEADNAATAYYNLSGMRVDKPSAGGIYVKVSGGKAEKLIVK